MAYSKPELTMLGNAAAIIQGTLVKQASPITEWKQTPYRFTNPAYEADE